MAVTGLVFSNVHDGSLPQLTSRRAMAAVPFGCRYRLIDFTLSNMVNSDIGTVHIVTQCNYQSLMGHIGSGKDWDLARRSGGVKLLPPRITAYDNNPAQEHPTRLSALKSVCNAITHIRDEYVVMSDCDVICNVDLNGIVNDHIASGADMTLAVKRMHLTPERARISVLYPSDASGRLTDVLTYPENFSGEADVSLNIVVIHRDYLKEIVFEAIARNYASLTKDVILRNLNRIYCRVYRCDGYFAAVSSFADYFRCNMDLLHNAFARQSLFGVPHRPIYTKVRNSAPTYYSPSSSVKNSLVADGCTVEGTVENSILFLGVKIGRNCTVKNSILMQDTIVGEGSFVNYAVSDKNAVIRSGRLLSGCEEQPYFIDKGKMI